MAQSVAGDVPSEWVAYTLQAAKLGLRSRTIFAPGDPGHDPGVLDIADLRGDGAGLTGVFSRYGNITASTGAEGVEYAGWTAFTPTAATVALAKQQVGVQITRERLMTTQSELNEWIKAGQELARSMASKVNVDVCAILASFTDQAGATTVNLTNANILTAVNYLEAANADRPYVVTLHTQQWYDLMTEASSPLVDASKTKMAEDFYGNYFYDDIYGLRWFITNDVPTATAGADRSGGMFNAEAIGLSWGLDFSLEVEWDKNKQLWELLMTGYWGVGIADDNCGAEILSDA